MSSSESAGFDAATRAIDAWANGFFPGATQDLLRAVANDLRTHKASILASVDRSGEADETRSGSAEGESAVPAEERADAHPSIPES